MAWWFGGNIKYLLPMFMAGIVLSQDLPVKYKEAKDDADAFYLKGMTPIKIDFAASSDELWLEYGDAVKSYEDKNSQIRDQIKKDDEFRKTVGPVTQPQVFVMHRPEQQSILTPALTLDAETTRSLIRELHAWGNRNPPPDKNYGPTWAIFSVQSRNVLERQILVAMSKSRK